MRITAILLPYKMAVSMRNYTDHAHAGTRSTAVSWGVASPATAESKLSSPIGIPATLLQLTAPFHGNASHPIASALLCNTVVNAR